MSDFLQRLAERTLGSAATVQPLIRSRFTSGLATQEPSQRSGESFELAADSPPAAAPAPIPADSPQPHDVPHRNVPPGDASAVRTDSPLPQPLQRPSAVGEGSAETTRLDDRRAAAAPHTIAEATAAKQTISSFAQPLAASADRIVEGIRAAPLFKIPEANTPAQATFRYQEDPERKDAPLIKAEPTALAAGLKTTVPLRAEGSVYGSPVNAVSSAQSDAGRKVSQQMAFPQTLPAPSVPPRAPTGTAPQMEPHGSGRGRLAQQTIQSSARLEQAVRRQVVEPVVPTAPFDRDVGPPAIGGYQASAEPAVIQVTIGRIEIRASVTAPPVRKTPPKSPAVGLDEYLSHRKGGRG